MGFIYNVGTIREFVATEYMKGSYGKMPNPANNYRPTFWCTEDPIGYDIAALVRDCLDNHSGSNYYTFVKEETSNQYYGIRIYQQNDIVYVKVATRSGQTGTIYDQYTITQYNVTSIPTNDYIYFLYHNDAAYVTSDPSETSRLLCTYKNYVMTLYTETVGGISYLVDDGTSEIKSTTYLPTFSSHPVVPYNYGDVYKTASMFNLQPNPVFFYNESASNFGVSIPTQDENGANLKHLVGAADSEPPEPYVPPTPPTPGEDPNDEGDPADEGGGDGNHTPIYDPIPIPDAPTMGAANAGFITMYKLGLAAINVFASDMFASNVWEAIRLFFSNPIDFLVGCMLLPFEPETGSSYHPKFGIVAFEHAYPAVSNQYKDIDCGSINISKYWGSCFDYEPFTKIQIWLPYIGYRDLPVDEIMDMTVSVKYRCDCLTGDCVAFVYTGVVGQTGPQVERVIAQFYGNCGVRVPFGSVSYDSAVAASIQLMGAAASIGLSPGAHGTPAMQKGEGGKAFEGIVSPQDVGLINAGVNVVTSMKPTVQKGGAAGASTGYMSIQKPYILRRIPRQNLPSNFMHLKGYPSNIGGTLSQFTGLAVVDDIQLNNIPAMEDERKEIVAWLKGGVLI